MKTGRGPAREDFVDAGKKAQNYRKAVGYAGEELAALLLLHAGATESWRAISAVRWAKSISSPKKTIY